MLCDLEYDASYLLYDLVCEIPFAFYVTFAGTTNLADVEKWLSLIEKYFRVVYCPKERKVKLATFLLHDSTEA